ncbi:hypothetical protein EMCRGX_G003665 [Ephydatia muelleri]
MILIAIMKKYAGMLPNTCKGRLKSYDTLAVASLRANMTVVGLMVAPKLQLKSVRSMQRNTPGLLDRLIGPKDICL